MRIVGGIYSSRHLVTRKGSDTRPTLDKVREAVFSSLGGMFEGGSVLDLYAGSGAVGLEALSRGMDHAVFADIARDAIEAVRTNIASLNVKDQTEVFQMKDMKVLQKLAEGLRKFDLVYLDPPYDHQHNNEILAFLAEHDMVCKGGRVVIESHKEEVYDQVFGTLHPYREKIYGISKITYYRAD